MTRAFHLWLGRATGLFLVILAITGVILAVDATGEGVSAPPPAPPALTVAELAARIDRNGTLEQITVTPAGTILARYAGSLRRAVVDPTSFAITPAPPQSEPIRLATEIHRTLTLGDAGRLVLALATLIGLGLAATGLVLAARRERGRDRPQWLHRVLGLAVAVPLTVSCATGLVLAVVAFFPLTVGGQPPAFPAVLAEGAPLPVGEVAALRAIAVADLEDLVLPRRGDTDDVYRLTTVDRFAHIDPVTGHVAAERARPRGHRITAALLRLHAGRGLPQVAIALGLAAAALPAIVATGLFWVAPRRRRSAAAPLSHRADEADTIVLIGTQGGTTQAFADRLAATLGARGLRVHIAAMNDVAAAYPRARRLLILTSTHGDGTAPASADRFLARLARLGRVPPVAVLGFGDREARRYCGFAEDVAAALDARGAPSLLPLHRIHRRDESDYAAWVDALLTVLDRTAAPAASLADGRPHGTAAGEPRLERRVLSGPTMASRWTVTIHVPTGFDPTPLMATLTRRISAIEASMSRFRADSEVVRLDAAPLGEWIAISDDLADVLAVALDVGRLSGGAFDVGLAAEVAAAGFGDGWASPGTQRAEPVPAHEALDLDVAGRCLRKLAPLSLDLAGIAKGWAIDAIADLVRDAGIAAHLVAIDGDLRAGAAPPGGRPWAIGLEAPAIGVRTTLGRLDLIERAAATSGDYRRFAHDAAHTLDPKTGLPVADGPASVTALAPTCAEADAWATALMVRGRAGLAAAHAARIDAIFVDRGVLTASAPRATPQTTRRDGAHP